MYYLNLDVDVPERFDFSKFVNYSDNFDILTSDLLYNLKNLAVGGQYKITSEEGRPDLISKVVYENYQYWWVILLYNDIYDVEDLTNGMVISYPQSSALDDYYFNLKRRQQENEE